MTIPDGNYISIGMHDTMEGDCGIALLLVRVEENPEFVYLLDPKSGPQSPFSRDELDEMVQDGVVSLFSQPTVVSDKDLSFYINPSLQTAFREITGDSIHLDNMKWVHAKGEQTIVGIAPLLELEQWRTQIAGLMSEKMDEKVIQELKSLKSKDFLVPLLRNIEQWGLCGALCAGDASMSLYRKFMVCVGASMSIRPDQHDRLAYTHEIMFEQYFPETSYNDFIVEAEFKFRAWERRNNLEKKIESRTADTMKQATVPRVLDGKSTSSPGHSIRNSKTIMNSSDASRIKGLFYKPPTTTSNHGKS